MNKVMEPCPKVRWLDFTIKHSFCHIRKQLFRDSRSHRNRKCGFMLIIITDQYVVKCNIPVSLCSIKYFSQSLTDLCARFIHVINMLVRTWRHHHLLSGYWQDLKKPGLEGLEPIGTTASRRGENLCYLCRRGTCCQILLAPLLSHFQWVTAKSDRLVSD